MKHFTVFFLIFFSIFSPDMGAIDLDGLMQAGLLQKFKLLKRNPQIIKTAKEGLTFKSKIPIVVTRMSYMKVADVDPIEEYVGMNLRLGCNECNMGKKQKLIFYPIDSEFKIESFMHLNNSIQAVLKDEAGKLISIREQIFKEMVDGGSGFLQNEELILIDILKKDVDKIEHQVSIDKFSLEQQKIVIESPMIRKNDFKNLFKIIATEEIGTPRLLQVSEPIKTENEYETIVNISADPKTYVALLHLKIIRPYFKVQDYGLLNEKYYSRWKNNKHFVLGIPAENLMKEAQNEMNRQNAILIETMKKKKDQR